MVREDYHETVLDYGRTDGINIPSMPEDKYFCIGYNSKYGLMDVLEDNGNSFFEGRVNIEDLLSKYHSTAKEEVNSQVYGFIMESYNNYCGHRKNPEENAKLPILEILNYKD